MRLVLALTLALAAACGRVGFDEGDAGLPPGTVAVGFATAMSLVDEAIGTARVSVTLSEPSGNTVSARYRVTGGTANSADFTLGGTGTVEIAPGTTQATIDLAITDDGVTEVDETINLVLEMPEGAALASRTHTITISANVLPRVSFTQLATAGGEGDGGSFSVDLDGPSSQPITIEVVRSGAANGDDASYQTSTVTFPPGIITKLVPLGVFDDALDEEDEPIELTLANPTNVIIGAIPKSQHTILDNDNPPEVMMTGDPQMILESHTAMLPIRLATASGKTVTVMYARVAGSASAGDATANGMVTFPPGETMRHAIVTGIDDVLNENTEEVFVNLTSAVNATISSTPRLVELLDDDPLPTAAFQTTGLSAPEGTGITPVAIYRISLSAPSGRTVTVPIAVTGSATSTDFSVSAVTAVFAAGEVDFDVQLSSVPDASPEPDEDVTLTLNNPVNVLVVAPATLTHVILNDD